MEIYELKKIPGWFVIGLFICSIFDRNRKKRVQERVRKIKKNSFRYPFPVLTLKYCNYLYLPNLIMSNTCDN